MRKGVITVALVCVCLGLAREATAQPRSRAQRTIRVGNLNVFVIGGGYNQHSHPTFDRRGFINFGYQRRVLRREIRQFPIWARVGANFTSQDIDLEDAFTVWDATAIAAGNEPYRETVQERTSDFSVRAELLADVIHTRNAALYGGGGFVVHIVSFRSRGLDSPFGINTRESLMGPSAVAGGRLFAARSPWTLYGEVRYGRMFGRVEDPAEGPLTDQQFDFTSVNSVSVEGGLGVHW